MITLSYLRNKFLQLRIKHIYKIFALCLLASILNWYFFSILNNFFFHYQSKMELYHDKKGVAFLIAVLLASSLEPFYAISYPI